MLCIYVTRLLILIGLWFILNGNQCILALSSGVTLDSAQGYAMPELNQSLLTLRQVPYSL